MFDFDMLGLSPALNKALAKAGLTQPTPIQNQAIPLALEGHDILGLAQTGTGKTLAFGLPLMEQLLNDPAKAPAKTVKALVLAPTRELVNQIADNLNMLAQHTSIHVRTVVGGQSINRQIAVLNRGTDILVATPGRLIDLMDRGAVDLSKTRHLVLDEADQMLDMGFIHALRKIAPKLGTPRQTMLFSATMPKQMEELSQAYLNNPRRVQVSPPGKAADKVTQSVHFLGRDDKPKLLREILSRDLNALTLVFARTKWGAEKLMKSLVRDGYNAASIHGNKSQNQRDRAIKGFRDGTITVLVATDVAARGIDIPGVAYVINYDLPDTPDNYVHRIGRTARAGREGEAIAFCTVDEAEQLRDIQKVMKLEIPVASGTPFLPSEAPKKPGGNRRRGGRGGAGNGGNGGGNRRGRSGSNGGGNGGGRPRTERSKADGGQSERPQSDRPANSKSRRPRRRKPAPARD
ncbi:DEAD/DEAH box helicase [Thalassovita mediterranea]|uniref:ATP-dependent RNA helicase RhlE n=1 Tax=Thalassovita mediterranea TaxID=340021 RepID=A0A0N7M2D7_9RHOB|nr:DEAD/DEAH box helicase [Thalassovita mediterranea]CUH85819.1 ATP-dependent RNA helicase RhlE [Thalassovita mediterranea]SIS32596.1 ATP-dependent RNA helicase RhlE [Thalassovita mediterranea]